MRREERGQKKRAGKTKRVCRKRRKKVEYWRQNIKEKSGDVRGAKTSRGGEEMK